MAESYFALGKMDQGEVRASPREDRQDAWVVWTLGALFESPFSGDLTFKGGTSLSKAYKIIDLFSEDLDLTYDIPMNS